MYPTESHLRGECQKRVHIRHTGIYNVRSSVAMDKRRIDEIILSSSLPSYCIQIVHPSAVIKKGLMISGEAGEDGH